MIRFAWRPFRRWYYIPASRWHDRFHFPTFQILLGMFFEGNVSGIWPLWQAPCEAYFFPNLTALAPVVQGTGQVLPKSRFGEDAQSASESFLASLPCLCVLPSCLVYVPSCNCRRYQDVGAWCYEGLGWYCVQPHYLGGIVCNLTTWVVFSAIQPHYSGGV